MLTISVLLAVTAPQIAYAEPPKDDAPPALIVTAPAPPTEQRAAQQTRFVFKSYPAGSLERGEEGTVGFVAAVERSGDLKSCRVTKTSGYALLDRATCDMLIANARFTPDKAVHGDKRMADITGDVVWRLPPDAARPATPPAQDPPELLARAAAPITCKYSLAVGSGIRRVKQCHSTAQWGTAIGYARAETERLQTSVPGRIQ